MITPDFYRVFACTLVMLILNLFGIPLFIRLLLPACVRLVLLTMKMRKRELEYRLAVMDREIVLRFGPTSSAAAGEGK